MHTEEERDDIDNEIDNYSWCQLLDAIKEHEEGRLEVKLYNQNPSGPMYMFSNVIVSGRFNVSVDCIKSHWIRYPRSKFGNEFKREFDHIWDEAKDNWFQRKISNRYIPQFLIAMFTGYFWS